MVSGPYGVGYGNVERFTTPAQLAGAAADRPADALTATGPLSDTPTLTPTLAPTAAPTTAPTLAPTLAPTAAVPTPAAQLFLPWMRRCGQDGF